MLCETLISQRKRTCANFDRLGPPTTLNTDLTLQAGTLALNFGTLTGTVNQSGGVFALTNVDFGAEDTLTNLTWQGQMHPLAATLHDSSVALFVDGSLTLQGSNGIGPGSLVIDQAVDFIFTGSQTLNDATVTFNGANDSLYGTLTAESSLTFGSHLTVDVAGYGLLDDDGQMTNNGTIDVAATAGTLAVMSDYGLTGTFTNAGTIAVDGTAQISAAGLDNTGTLNVAAGGTLALTGQSNGAWQNTGAITIDGQLDLYGTLTAAQLAALAPQFGAAATAALDGDLNNAGNNLQLGAGGVLPALTLAGGEIDGGTITAPGAALILDGGTLSGVTMATPLALTSAGDALTIANGISFTGKSSIKVTGAAGASGDATTLGFTGTQTLTGVTIDIGSIYGNVLDVDTGATLTLGAGSKIDLLAGVTTVEEYASGGTIVNDATISASRDGTLSLLNGITFVNNGSASLAANSILYADTNNISGAAIAINSGVLELGDVNAAILSQFALTKSTLAVAGSLTAYGETITVGANGISALRIGASAPDTPNGPSASISGGTIVAANGNVALGGTVTLTGVTYQGNLNVTASYTQLTVNALKLLSANGQHPGTLTLGGQGSALIVQDATLDHMTIVLNGTTLEAPGGAQTFGQHLIIEAGAAGGTINGGTLTSDADITAKGALTLGAGLFVNKGSVQAQSGTLLLGYSYFDNAGTIAAASAVFGAGETTNSGTMTVAGKAVLNYGNYYRLLPPGGTSFDNIGTLTLDGGLGVAAANGAAVPLLNEKAALIIANGIIKAPIDNHGTISVTSGSLAVTGNITGAGTLDIGNAGTLSLTGKIAGQIVNFGGPDGVLGLDEQKFISTIGGFAAGDTIDLFSLQASAASFSGASIVVTLTAGRTVDLKTTAALTGSLDVTSDGHGGSLIDFAGTLPAGTVIAGPVGAVSGGWPPSADATTMPHIWVGVEGHDVAQGVLL